MDKLQHPVGRGISYLLIYLTATYPLHPAFAVGITPTSSATQVQTGNVPVINIAAPNGAGISHNTFNEFNVGAPGAVLNNATATGTSTLAGQINANNNLNGKAATLIINEVTGGRRSGLNGKLEVFGNNATVMIANPNGITCNGCSFINTPAVTLTTGKPQFDQQGALAALDVESGAIRISREGLDASGQDYVDLISRTTELKGTITAQHLALTQGTNHISFADGSVTVIDGNGSDTKPKLAVDTKALGGMYANKIRLVATEEGVGVNLANLTATQQGITLSANGNLRLGNTQSKSDVNISAKQVEVAKGVTVNSERDITLASSTFTNKGSLTASQDMRLFTDQLTNTQATIQANNTLWIQKDAQGNKSGKVENRSGTIKTGTGDMVIRTEVLDNVRAALQIKEKDILPDSASINANLGVQIAPDPNFQDQPKPIVIEGVFDSSVPKKWFGHVMLYKDNHLHTAQKQVALSSPDPASLITAGNHLYINAGILNNLASDLNATKDMFLTGETLNNRMAYQGGINTYSKIAPTSNIPIDWIQSPINIERVEKLSSPFQGRKGTLLYGLAGEEQELFLSEVAPGIIHAGNNLVADFKGAITLGSLQPINDEGINQVTYLSALPQSISANNILFHADSINILGGLNAADKMTLLADESMQLRYAQLAADNVIDILSTQKNDLLQTQLTAKEINIQAREGDITFSSDDKIRHYSSDGTRQFSQLNASDNLRLQAGNDLTLSSVSVGENQNTALIAGNNLTVQHNATLLLAERLGDDSLLLEKQQRFNEGLAQAGHFLSQENITLNAGNVLSIAGAHLTAGKDISLSAGKDINLNPRTLTNIPSSNFSPSRQPELSTTLKAGNQLLLSSGRDLIVQSATLSAEGSATLLAGNDLHLLATPYSAIDSHNDNNKDDRHVVTQIDAGKNLTLAANGELIAHGATLSSGGDMTVSAGGNMALNAVTNHLYREGYNEFSESVTQQSASLNSAGALTLLSHGSILFQATQLIAQETLDAAAKGGFLYAQAMEDVSHYEKTTKKSNWWGHKTTIKQTSHNSTNKVTAFSAGGDINLLSRDDSTFEASKIDAGNNATLTSTQGKINFKAVKDSAFEQTLTTSKGFFITSADKGYSKDTWRLPNINTGGKLTVDAAAGISADIKNQNNQTLNNALLTLGSTPGTTWLGDLNTRDDVQWNQVQDAYSSWNHKSQSLNPVVAAVIAIAVAAVTAGSGLAATMGDLAAGTVGSTSAAVTTATYGAAYSGMTALTSQAAVALIDNQGNLSKTLAALGSSNSVKSLVTAMVIGGALAGFDSVMGFDKAAGGASAANPGNAKLPLLSNGDWSKIAQRVAGQSIISSSLNTAINGGSFSDNFASALLATVGNQVQAEGAHLIGDNGDILDVPGKAVSHAVVAGVAAEIGGGNGKGAAAGALAAELAGVILGDNIIKPEEWQKKSEQQAQMARVLGSVAGAVFTGKAEGANSGATGGEAAFRYNYLSHKQKELMDQDLSTAKTPLEKAFVLARWGVTSGKQDGAFAAGVISGVPVEFVETAQSLIALVTDPAEAWDALKALINEDDAWAKVSSSVKQGYINRIDAMKAYYQQAGADGAYYSGLEFGKLATEAAGVVLGAAGVAKGATTLATNTAKALEKAAANTTVSLAEDMAWKGITDPKYLNELLNNGIKFTPDDILKIEKLSDGRIIFLEKGNSQSGLQHILERHAEDFLRTGVNEKQIPDLVIKALSEGKIVGYQGKGTGRPIYEVEFNGKNQRVSITVGSNGYIVGANPAGSY